MANQITPLPGYPGNVANKKWEVFGYTGPASYVAGGDPVAASTLGWGGFDWISNCMDSSGTYYLEPSTVGGSNNAKPTILIRWIVAATGADAAPGTNLSAVGARLLAIGV